MIDIHTHVLPLVDDGSIDNNLSLAMIKECVNQGVTDVFLTPHYRKMFKLPPNILKSEFEKFKNIVSNENIPVNLYLGQEVFIEGNYKQIFQDKKVLTMNDSNFLLIEFDYEDDVDMPDIVYELKMLGYTPIIAHYERYLMSDIETALEIKSLGGLIQINADSIVGKTKRYYSGLIKKLFKNNAVDFVASDIHFNRVNHLLHAKQFVQKKFGEETANKVFVENAKMIIKG